MLQKPPRHLLVVKNRALGDAVISLGTIQYLRELFPKTKITYLVPAWVQPLFANVPIAADEVVGMDLKSFAAALKTWKKLRELQPDCIFEMSQSGRGQKFFSAYAWWNRISYVAHNHHVSVGSVVDQGVQKPIIQRDLDGAWSFFSKQEPRPSFLNYPPRFQLSTSLRIKRIVFGMVATRETKLYPLEMYAELAHEIKKQKPEYELVALVSKSAQDQSIQARFQAMNAPVVFQTLGLSELPKYFAESSLYLGNDTGLKHIAVAAGIPTLTLFGPEPPLEWHPYAIDKHVYLYRDPLPCRYETGRTYCPLSTCSSMICLNQFTPEQIYKTVEKFLL